MIAKGVSTGRSTTMRQLPIAATTFLPERERPMLVSDRIFHAFAALTIALLVMTALPGLSVRAQTGDDVNRTTPAYVGSQSCFACHEGEAASWTGSHHDLAWTLPSETTVLGNFDNAAFEHKGVVTRFFRRDGDYFVMSETSGNSSRVMKVVGVAGVAPLQQYLLETEPGRLQSFDVVWDVERQEWYHLYPDQDLPPDDGLHWSGPYKSWNARCAECHATGFEKNYDIRTRRYQSRQAEIGVGCEACHGPGEAHNAWAQAPDRDLSERWPGLDPQGFTITFSAGPNGAETEIQQCATCHARREPFLDGNPLPGLGFHDTYRLSLLRPGLYHPDGSIQDEVYVYGSFLQSKMYAKGVRCSDCHDVHAADLRLEGNATCTQCHNLAGNTRFPSLAQALYDDPSHHFHEQGSEAADCKSCHMIERVYMGIDGRRDHSFRVPRPDLSSETGSPDACTDCHGQRDAAWAAREIAIRFPDSNHRGPHFSQAFFAARSNPGAAADDLIAIATHDRFPAIIRASALDLVLPAANAAIADGTATLLSDANPVVRAAAVPLQRSAPVPVRVQRLVPLLSDTVRAVRMAVAREFLDIPIARMPEATTKALQAARQEWFQSLLAKADFPESHMAIGGAALTQRNLQAAEQAFQEAVRLDPQLLNAWTMIIRIRASNRDIDGVARALNEALKANPGQPDLLAMQRDFENAR